MQLYTEWAVFSLEARNDGKLKRNLHTTDNAEDVVALKVTNSMEGRGRRRNPCTDAGGNDYLFRETDCHVGAEQ
jgi:hypothetical protein